LARRKRSDGAADKAALLAAGAIAAVAFLAHWSILD
jgi:hypothetical protein